MGFFDTIWNHYKFGGGYTDEEKHLFQQDLFNNNPGVGVAVVATTGIEAEHPKIVDAIKTIGEPIATVVQTTTDTVADAYWLLRNPLLLGALALGAVILIRKI